MAFQFMPGATAIGITCTDGIVLAAEKRVSYGNFVVNKTTKQVVPIAPSVAAACAGMIADMQVLVRQVAALSKIRRLETRREVANNSVAKLMSVIMFERRDFPLLTQVVVGGIDPNPSIYTLDPLGSLLPDDYAAVGTGAEMALGVLDSEYKKDISTDVARNLAVKAIKSSIQRYSASGDGIDLVIITDKGIQEDTIKL